MFREIPEYSRFSRFVATVVDYLRFGAKSSRFYFPTSNRATAERSPIPSLNFGDTSLPCPVRIDARDVDIHIQPTYRNKVNKRSRICPF